MESSNSHAPEQTSTHTATTDESASGSLVIEVALFRTKAGTEEAVLLDAIEESQRGFLAQCPGFIRRELAKGEDGQWLDMVYWQSLHDAQRAAQAFPTHPSARRFEHLLDVSSVTMLHLEQVKQW